MNKQSIHDKINKAFINIRRDICNVMFDQGLSEYNNSDVSLEFGNIADPICRPIQPELFRILNIDPE
jgi:hypothetical protein